MNSVLGHLQTAINGTYHAFRFSKYAPHYPADLQYRFNRRYTLLTIAAATRQPRLLPRGQRISSRGLSLVIIKNFYGTFESCRLDRLWLDESGMA